MKPSGGPGGADVEKEYVYIFSDKQVLLKAIERRSIPCN